jgi:CDP-diacylglycerol--glycerol-3-phosphate 3-phosphatidyltransferase
MTALTPANQMTFLRMLLIPAFVILVVYHYLGSALLVFGVAGLTDALDGLLARRSGQNSSLGAWLDPMADKLLAVSTFVVLTLPGLDLANRLPVWLTVLIISRDVAIVATVAIVNLAIGRRTFLPSIWGKIATATYMLTAIVAMLFNYLGFHSVVVDVFVYGSLVITLVSSFHYIRHAARIIDAPTQSALPRKKVVALLLTSTALFGASPSLEAQAPRTPASQAVVETSVGNFTIELTPDVAPNQAAYFAKTAQEGGYDGTSFHRVVKYGMVQGGDPLSKDSSKRAQFGTGGLNALKAEARAPKMTRGSVAAVLIPGRPDSAGAQFFIILADQPALDGQYTVFGRVWDGMEVLQKISETAVDASGLATERVEIRRVTMRDAPPELFIGDPPEKLATYRAILDTSAGLITLEFFPDKAPETTRQFLRLADAGVYNGMAFHRVAPGFVIQTGALSSRQTPLSERQQKLVRDLPPEFNNTKHVKGIVSMARGQEPTSASTSFFICTGTSPALDGVYTAFGRMVDGMAAVEAIESSPRTGETPNARIDLRTIRVVGR